MDPLSRSSKSYFPQENIDPLGADISGACENFWETHIKTFEYTHATSSLYLPFFERHGISEYPHQMIKPIKKILALFHKYEKKIPLSWELTEFEENFNHFVDSQIKMSFTANTEALLEFDHYKKYGGGAWLKGVRDFLYNTQEKKIKFSEKEKKLIKKIEHLQRLLSTSEPLHVVVVGGSSAMENIDDVRGICPWLSLSKKKFVEIVLNSIGHGESVYDFLNQKIFQRIIFAKKLTSTFADQGILPENLIFRKVFESHEISQQFPYLKMGETREFSKEETLSLGIWQSGFSQREEYRDSKFEIVPIDEANTRFRVTRMKLSQEDKERHQIRTRWLQRLEHPVTAKALAI